MWRSNSSPFSLSLLAIILSFASIHVFAIPSSPAALPLLNQHHQEPRPSHSVFPQLTWLRNTIIETVFRLPKPSSSNGRSDKLSAPNRPYSPQLPSTLLAKYGGDVVLRFNLSTPEEETALSEAADTLFLDVWEFNNNWADIRMREDDVGIQIDNSL